MKIGFGELSWYMLFPLFLPAVNYGRTYVLLELSHVNDDFNLSNHPFILTFLMLLGESLSGFLELILYFNKKRKKFTFDRNRGNSITRKATNKMATIYAIKKQPVLTIDLILRVVLIICLDVCAMITFSITSEEDEEYLLLESKITSMQILIISVLSYFILKLKLYHHQMISIVLIVVGTLLISFNSFIYVQHWENLGYILLCYLMWDTQEVTEKWTMERLNVSPYKLLFLNGVVGSILLIILFIPLAYIPCNLSFCDNGVVEHFLISMGKVFASTTIALLAFAYLILCFIYNLFLMITKKVFTPNHKSSFDAFTCFIWWVFYMIKDNKIANDFTMALIGYIIIVIGVLLYNEIIICYFFNLHLYTKKCIIERNIRENEVSSLELEELIMPINTDCIINT